MQNLDKVYDALEDIASVGGKNLKLEKLKRYLPNTPWLEETILYALHPFKHYKTTKVKEVKHDGLYATLPAQRLFLFLDKLAEQKGASKDDKNHLSYLASMSTKSVNVVNRIIKKDLRCGVAANTAQKCLPDLPIYKVMKAICDNPFPGKNWIEFVESCGGIEYVVSSLKVDGYRTSYITVFENGEVEYISTGGKPYHNFQVFNKEMITLAKHLSANGLKYPMKFDGEAISTDVDFQTMQKHARRESNIDLEVYRLLLWEVVTYGPFRWRYDALDCLKTTTGEKYDLLEIFEQNPDTKVFRLHHDFGGYPDTKSAVDEVRRAIAGGNEGLMFKTPKHEHELKRSKDWFKTKALYLKGEGVEVDLPVIGFKFGREGTKYEAMLGAFTVEFNGVRVDISGKMSDKQRQEWVEDLPSWITVHADSVTDDGSLRLPIFQHVRYDK